MDLYDENERLREALDYIVTNANAYAHEWVRNYARAALNKTDWSDEAWEREEARAALQDEPGTATYNERWKSKP
jgi:hypothetical protein